MAFFLSFPFLFFPFYFLSVKNFACVRLERLSVFHVIQVFLGKAKCNIVLENLVGGRGDLAEGQSKGSCFHPCWLRDRAKAAISIPVLSPVWPLTHPECNRKFLGLGSGVMSTRATAGQAEFKL